MSSHESQPENVDEPPECWFAERAAMATNMAYLRAKAQLQTVVISKNGYIVAEFPDGTEETLGVSKRRRVQAGVAVNLRVAPVNSKS
ncbi:hypothetical protein [Halopseudomonas sp.]|jgi:hypothetical protein|uniref:hypothetical protein n=1 Tax=Halopseudomonas sp. TaxID=2901191 RepID=UPI0039E72446